MTAFTYIGDGASYLEGIPKRDLDEDDWSHLDDERKASVQASSLYEVADETVGETPKGARRKAAPGEVTADDGSSPTPPQDGIGDTAP